MSEKNDIFVIKLGPLFLTSNSAKPWSHDPNEAANMTFDVAQSYISGSGEVITVNPLEQVTYTVRFESYGRIILTDLVTHDIAEAICQASDYPSLDVSIQVADVYLTQEGFSNTSKYWR
ncbi:hypothetical protein ABGV42_01775 [Paenibacillus pabuli]|uniref:hypothetical protein n=1 Tax=Paenibacillus pabuli TaxID=1472 RepID=UPI003242359F